MKLPVRSDHSVLNVATPVMADRLGANQRAGAIEGNRDSGRIGGHHVAILVFHLGDDVGNRVSGNRVGCVLVITKCVAAAGEMVKLPVVSAVRTTVGDIHCVSPPT